MAAFAARMRLSETSFVQTPTEGPADYRHRIFTVAGEIPFAGHPSLGTAAAVASAKRRPSARLAQQTGAGIQELVVEMAPDGSHATVDLTQNPPEHLGTPDPEPVLAALGLGPDDRHPTLPAEVISTGLPTLILPVRDPEVLARPAPDLEALAREARAARQRRRHVLRRRPSRCRRLARPLFHATGGERGGRRHWLGCRSAGGVGEPSSGLPSIVIDQGIEMGSPSRLYGRVQGEAVIVSGSVRLIGEGTIELPDSSK